MAIQPSLEGQRLYCFAQPLCDLLEGTPTESDSQGIRQQRPSVVIEVGKFRRPVEVLFHATVATPRPLIADVPEPAFLLKAFEVLIDAGKRAADELLEELLRAHFPHVELGDDLQPKLDGEDDREAAQVARPRLDTDPDLGCHATPLDCFSPAERGEVYVLI